MRVPKRSGHATVIYTEEAQPKGGSDFDPRRCEIRVQFLDLNFFI